MMTAGKNGQVLYGDWRCRYGSKTDAHLFGAQHILDPDQPSGRRPMCGRAIKHKATVAVHQGRPWTDCLVAGIRRAS